MSFPRYPKYKASGVEWLGKAPDHWEVVRLKTLCRLITKKAEHRNRPVALENIESGTGRIVDSDTEYDGEGTAFVQGDLLFGKLRPYLAKAWIADSAGEAIGDFHVLRRIRPHNDRYLLYTALSRDFLNVVDSSTYGSRMPRVSWDFLSCIPVCAPPLAEQRAIAAFLDRETAKIDALIAEQEKLFQLLAEKRQAVISHAVTKGIKPGVRMRSSGIDSLGDVPEHWDIVRIGRKIELQRGIDITKDRQRNGDVPVVSSGGIASFHDVALTRGPGVVVGRKGSAGALFFIDRDYWPHDTTLYVRTFNGNHPAFVYFKLMSLDLSSYDTGSSNPTLNRNRIHPIIVGWPDVDEQVLIADALWSNATACDLLTAEMTHAVALLRERRSALISAAVTGQIDVRNAVPVEAA